MKATAVAGGTPDNPETEQTKTPAEPESGTAPRPGAETGAESASGTEVEAQAAPEAEVDAEAGTAAHAGAGDRAGTEPEAGAEAEAAAPAVARPEADAQPDADVEPRAGTETEDEPHAEAGPEPEPEPEPGAEADAGVDPDAEVDPETDAADAQPEARAHAETGAADAPAGADAEVDAAPRPEPGAEAEAEAETEPAPQPEPGAEAEAQATDSAEAAREAGAGPDGEVEAEPELKAGPEAGAGAGVRPGAGSGAGAAEGQVEANAEANADAEGQVEADAEAGTAGSESAGPAEAGTTRRVPSWARAAEADSERTSQFVALKPLDAPAPVAAPRPGPAQVAAPARKPVPAQAPAPAATPGPGATQAPVPKPKPVPAQAPAPAPAPKVTPPPAAAAPLELLAELTNTVAPPRTPRRNALRRVAIWTPVLLVLAGGFAGAQLLRPLPAPKLVAAETGHTVDGRFSIPWPAKGQGAVRVSGSGDIGTFGEQKPVPTASVAKVMTAYVILKSHPLKKNDPGPAIRVDAKTVADGTAEHESRIVGLTAGTEFSQQDMLKMLMIPSGNNVARLLARWDTGSDSETAFVEKMNAAARELGMTNTTYTDPSGLDAGTVSTATDQLKLAEAVMKDEAFRAIVALPSATIKGLPQQLLNNNDLLTAQGLSVRGIKTGSSTPAGGALMWAAYKSVGDETPLILGTLMDQRVDGPDPDAVNSLALVKTNSKKIIEAVRAALASAPVVRKGDTVGYVDDGLGGRTPLVATKDLNVIGVPGQQFALDLASGAPKLPHTAKAGTEVAALTAGDGEGAKSVPVAVGGPLSEPSFATRLTRLR
ncbi:serine hydrolase [Streptomyces sp. NPDC048349]|uniref:D-alanyl-D-alanine carboxypeptidase n=1 Tax=Streptomyces sp. NPDC048349 TaxID=3155486 RepID=UPI00342795A6